MAFRVIFFGSDCLYSQVVLESLVAAGINVAAVWLAGKDLPGIDKEVTIKPLLPHNAHIADNDPNSLRVISPFIKNSVLQTAWDQGIPTLCRPTHPCSRDRGRAEVPGARIGLCGVLSPSCSRKPLICSPLWLLKRASIIVAKLSRAFTHLLAISGRRKPMGVTVHWMDAEFDTGPIASQRAMALPDGTSETDATALLARVGGRLLVDAVKTRHSWGDSLPDTTS